MIGFATVRRGERAAVWNREGDVRYVDGPRRMLLWRETMQPLQLVSARPDEYLVIRCVDGRVEHLPGPAAVWLEPVVHASIEVRKALSVSANEAIVVYAGEPGGVTRRIVDGPALFVPAPHEWLHTFRWHGADPKNSKRKIPSALEFTRLRVIPDQMYLDVEDVRTADDALICVKLMIFFEIASVTTMLQETHDPVADFINAVTADVIDFAAAREFVQFKDATARLNELATYPQLTGRARRIGYQINKVVYRGYRAGEKLQLMHDNAIEARTRLQLDSETEQQAQDLADLKLAREESRVATRQQMAQSELEHKNALQRLAHAEAMRQKELERESELLHKEALRQGERAQLAALHEMGVELTRYLVARYQHPDRVIRIEGDQAPQLHMHEM